MSSLRAVSEAKITLDTVLASYGMYLVDPNNRPTMDKINFIRDNVIDLSKNYQMNNLQLSESNSSRVKLIIGLLCLHKKIKENSSFPLNENDVVKEDVVTDPSPQRALHVAHNTHSIAMPIFVIIAIVVCLGALAYNRFR